MIVHSNKKSDLPDNDLMNKWRKLEVTGRVWDYFQRSYNPIDGLRTCPPDQIPYFRAIADVMDDLGVIFAKK